MGVVNKLTNVAQDLADTTIDGIEQMVTPAMRAGAVVNRAGSMSEGGVKHNVIALQMSESSPNGYTYSTEFVDGLVNLHHDSKTKVVLTKKAATTLIKDQVNFGVRRVDDEEDSFVDFVTIIEG